MRMMARTIGNYTGNAQARVAPKVSPPEQPAFSRPDPKKPDAPKAEAPKAEAPKPEAPKPNAQAPARPQVAAAQAGQVNRAGLMAAMAKIRSPEDLDLAADQLLLTAAATARAGTSNLMVVPHGNDASQGFHKQLFKLLDGNPALMKRLGLHTLFLTLPPGAQGLKFRELLAQFREMRTTSGTVAETLAKLGLTPAERRLLTDAADAQRAAAACGMQTKYVDESSAGAEIAREVRNDGGRGGLVIGSRAQQPRLVANLGAQQLNAVAANFIYQNDSMAAVNRLLAEYKRHNVAPGASQSQLYSVEHPGKR